MVFDITNTKEDTSHTLSTRDERLFASAHCFCYGISSFVEAVILLLLCSTSIGQNNFYRSWFVARYMLRVPLLHWSVLILLV